MGLTKVSLQKCCAKRSISTVTGYTAVIDFDNLYVNQSISVRHQIIRLFKEPLDLLTSRMIESLYSVTDIEREIKRLLKIHPTVHLFFNIGSYKGTVCDYTKLSGYSEMWDKLETFSKHMSPNVYARCTPYISLEGNRRLLKGDRNVLKECCAWEDIAPTYYNDYVNNLGNYVLLEDDELIRKVRMYKLVTTCSRSLINKKNTKGKAASSIMSDDETYRYMNNNDRSNPYWKEFIQILFQSLSSRLDDRVVIHQSMIETDTAIVKFCQEHHDEDIAIYSGDSDMIIPAVLSSSNVKIVNNNVVYPVQYSFTSLRDLPDIIKLVNIVYCGDDIAPTIHNIDKVMSGNGIRTKEEALKKYPALSCLKVLLYLNVTKLEEYTSTPITQYKCVSASELTSRLEMRARGHLEHSLYSYNSIVPTFKSLSNYVNIRTLIYYMRIHCADEYLKCLNTESSLNTLIDLSVDELQENVEYLLKNINIA